MNESQKPDFVKMITEVLAFYKQDTSRFAISVWWEAAKHFDFEQVSKALTAHAMDPDRGQFPPKPADLVRQLQGTSADRAMIAWGKVHEAMGRVGAYSDVVFDDPAIHAAVEDLGGWVKMCRGEISELSYLQHRFCEAHKAYTNRGQFDYPRRLIGDRSPDELFAKRGLKPPAPAVVGDVEQARLVYRGGAIGGKTEITFNAAELALSGLKAIQ
jgi:hypothetical protein